MLRAIWELATGATCNSSTVRLAPRWLSYPHRARTQLPSYPYPARNGRTGCIGVSTEGSEEKEKEAAPRPVSPSSHPESRGWICRWRKGKDVKRPTSGGRQNCCCCLRLDAETRLRFE